MQPPSPTGALAAPSFYALGWRRMGKQTDSLRMRYLDKVRKMREVRNKKLGGVRNPKVAPATPMDTTQSETPTSKYTAEQKLLLNRFRISIDTFGSEAEAEWAALWPQSLGPGLEEAERAMRSFHLPNGELELYVQEYDPDASDEMVTVQVLVNLCYLLCKGETEDFRNTWAEMEVAYAEYLQKVASASGGSAMDVSMTTPTAAPATNMVTLPTGPVWSGREAKKDAVAKTCLYAVKGAIVGVGSTYISAQGVATLVGLGLLGPGVAATIATGASAVLVGNFVLKPLLERVIAGVVSLPLTPLTPAGVLLDGALAVPLRTGELDLVNYEDTLQKLVSEEKGEIVKFLCGIGPNSLQGQVAIKNQEKLFNKPLAKLAATTQKYIRRGQLEIDGGELTRVGKLDDGVVTNLFRKHHITAQLPEATDSSLLSGGQEAVMDRMDLASKRNKWYHFKKAREEYVKEATQLDSAEGADDSILPNRPWRIYGIMAASHLASGFAQQRWAKQKITVDYLKVMIDQEDNEEQELTVADMEARLSESAMQAEDDFQEWRSRYGRGPNPQPGQPMESINYAMLQWNRARSKSLAYAGRLERSRRNDNEMGLLGKALGLVRNRLCLVSDSHIVAYITRGERSNPMVGIVRAFEDQDGNPFPRDPELPATDPLMDLPDDAAPLDAAYHTASAYVKDKRGRDYLGRFRNYTTRSASEERRTLCFYFEDVLIRNAKAILNRLAPRVDPNNRDNKERDFSAVGGWLGMNPRGTARGDLDAFYAAVERFNTEKVRLINNRLLALGPGERWPTSVFANANQLETINYKRKPCKVTAAAPSGAVSVVDAAFARLAV
jgi:hypothetical protein